MKYDVISAGEPVIDFVPVDTEEGLVYKAYPGGGAVNVLAEVCAMGGSALILGVVGQDHFGEFLLEQVKKRGIDISGIYRTSKKNTGIGFVRLSAKGERSFLSYRDYDTKVRLYRHEDLGVVEQCRIFHFTSVSLVSEVQREDTFKAAFLAAKTGLLSFDVNYREAMWKDAQTARALFLDCIEKSDIVKLSEEEKQFLCGDQDNFTAARALSGHKDKLILISMGSEGSYYYNKGREGICPSFSVTAKDTTGCGDAFIGALLGNLTPWIKKGAALSDIPKEELERIMTLANGAGAICASRFGSLSAMPYRSEVEDFIREKEVVVIMGAGLSGRGYLARQLDLGRYQLVFLDKNKTLVDKMALEGSYEIHFFGGKRETQRIEDYLVYLAGDPEGDRLLRRASYLLICVGQENLEEASAYAAGVLGRNPDRLKAVIAAENGTDSLEKMKKHFCFQNSLLTECLMLCTTTGTESGLDVWSEDMDYLPYDSHVLTQRIPFEHFVPCGNFSSLVRRKIYTYNTLSACIAYLGAYKGYTNYGQAALDPEIFAVTERLECALNQAVCQEYQVDEREQAEFSALAKQKFRNQEIWDTISRNARNVFRKLGPGERIAEPLRFMVHFNCDIKPLILTAAAAILYGVCQEGMEAAVLAERLDIQMLKPVMEMYTLLREGVSITEIMG